MEAQTEGVKRMNNDLIILRGLMGDDFRQEFPWEVY